MIVRERFAVCEAVGCRSRTLVDEDVHPKTWPAMIDATGTHYFCSHVCLHEAAISLSPTPFIPRWPLGLTPHDVELLWELGHGYANGQIGAHLDLAESTVKNRLSRLYARLHAPSRIELVLRAGHLGLVNLNTLAAECSGRLLENTAPEPPPFRRTRAA